MNITNVVLDRDKQIVTYDTADKEGLWDKVCWSIPYGNWRCVSELGYYNDINACLMGLMFEESKPDQVTTFTIPEYYNNQYKGLKIDPYRIFKIYHIQHSCQQHAIKKLLRGTNKGDIKDDLELIESLEGILARWKEMIKEDAE